MWPRIAFVILSRALVPYWKTNNMNFISPLNQKLISTGCFLLTHHDLKTHTELVIWISLPCSQNCTCSGLEIQWLFGLRVSKHPAKCTSIVIVTGPRETSLLGLENCRSCSGTWCRARLKKPTPQKMTSLLICVLKKHTGQSKVEWGLGGRMSLLTYSGGGFTEHSWQAQRGLPGIALP